MIEGFGVVKEFGRPPQTVLHGLDFRIENGEFVSISGRSGSGKSTLLYLISTLDLPSKGKVLIDGRDIAKMNSQEVHEFRNRNVGFIFQFHFLLPELTAMENVLLPARNLNQVEEKRAVAMQLLKLLGIEKQANKFPSQMSGGEQQRVAIARAFSTSPQVLFADEPTGNLDPATGAQIIDLMFELNRESQTTLVLVTHDESLSARCARVVRLLGGQVIA